MTEKEKTIFTDFLLDAWYMGYAMLKRILTKRIWQALENTFRAEDRKSSGVPFGYTFDLWTKHLGAGAAGSVFDTDKWYTLVHCLALANWEEFQPKHLIPGCTYLRAYIKNAGFVAADLLQNLPADSEVQIKKGISGFEVQKVISGRKDTLTDMVTLILGKTDDNKSEIVFTIHPGEPLPPADAVKNDSIIDGAIMTARSAMSLGFKTVKYVIETPLLNEGLVQMVARRRCGFGETRMLDGREQTIWYKEQEKIRKEYNDAENKFTFLNKLEAELK